jgi:hypothetical protein
MLAAIVLKLELLLLLRHFILFVLLRLRHIFTHDILLLSRLLFSLALSLLLPALLLLLLSTLLVCSGFALCVFLALTLLLLLLPPALGLLFSVALLLSLLLGKHLSLSFGLSSRFLVVILAAFVVVLDSKNLHDVGRRVNTGGCSMEHLLQEKVGLFGFVTRDDFCWLAVDLFANDELRQRDQLREPVDLGFFLSDRFAIELLLVEEPVSETSDGHRVGEDVVDVAEGRLRKQLFVEFGLLDDLLVQLRGHLPILFFCHCCLEKAI